MTDTPEDPLDSLFHACALAAYLDQAQAEQGWPSSEATRVRAYRYYEDALAAKAGRQLSARHEAEADALAFIDHAADTGEEP
jgi:hypothetical protein